MKKVYQTREGTHDGNCFLACLASVLEIPLEDVPDVDVGKAEDLWALQAWMKLTYKAYLLHVPIGDIAPWGCREGIRILSGKTPGGNYHSVVVEGGVLIHDPFRNPPAGIEKLEVVDHWYVVPLDPSALTRGAA